MAVLVDLYFVAGNWPAVLDFQQPGCVHLIQNGERRKELHSERTECNNDGLGCMILYLH